VRWFGDAHGATAIEYAMIASMISILIVTGVTTIGTKLLTYFQEVIAPYL